MLDERELKGVERVTVRDALDGRDLAALVLNR